MRAGTIHSAGLGFTSAKRFAYPESSPAKQAGSGDGAPGTPSSPMESFRASNLAATEYIRSTKKGATNASVRLARADSRGASPASRAKSESPSVGVIKAKADGLTSASYAGRASPARVRASPGAAGSPGGGSAVRTPVGVIRSRACGSTTAAADYHRTVPRAPAHAEPTLHVGVIRAAEKGYTTATTVALEDVHSELHGAALELDAQLASASPTPGYSYIKTTNFGSTDAGIRSKLAEHTPNEERIESFRQRAPVDGDVPTIRARLLGQTTRSMPKHEADDAEMRKDSFSARPSSAGYSPHTIRLRSVPGCTTASLASPDKHANSEMPAKPMSGRDPTVVVAGYKKDPHVSQPVLKQRPADVAPRRPVQRAPSPLLVDLDAEILPTPPKPRATATSSGAGLTKADAPSPSKAK